MQAFRTCGVDPNFYAGRVRDREEVLPWSVTATGVSQAFLWRERERAYQAVITPDCRVQCTGCGADKLYPGVFAMPKHRLAFSKADTAKYISHLDLMRTFQRAFLRAGLPIKHTEGFNPHAFVSIPLPLSVGYSSACEVLECELLGEVDGIQSPARMTAALPRASRCTAATRPRGP